MSTAIVWFRRDLRVHDHPPLFTALQSHDQVVPVFVIDDRLVHGRFPSGARAAFMLGSLDALDDALRERGGGLVLRDGRPEDVLPALARETGAAAVHFAGDVSPFAMARDRRVEAALGEAGVEAVRTAGNFAADVGRPRTKDGRPFTVFTPFWRAWEQLERRTVHRAPPEVRVPRGVDRGRIPRLADLGVEAEVGDPPPPGEVAGRELMDRWLGLGIDRYAQRHDTLAAGTSGLAPYLHWGCVSARELEERARRREGEGPAAFVRQLAWRDFYAHVLLLNPDNARVEFQPRYRELEWEDDDGRLDAWREGRTGYPVVDAAMRQLRATGWMHNRGRLIVGSFLTKDLHLDWRLGEAHFMRYLIDGDEASNNGNWQWIASVGVDRAPYFRRMFNPTLQQQKFDPEGEYVRRWVPELAGVPGERLAEPWRMTEEDEAAAGCVIGRDYPAPIVDHGEERRRAMERYRAASEAFERRRA